MDIILPELNSYFHLTAACAMNHSQRTSCPSLGIFSFSQFLWAWPWQVASKDLFETYKVVNTVCSTQ